jgi:hypothetical protein
VNDDNGQMTNKRPDDDEDNNVQKLIKSSSNINDNSKNSNLVHSHLNKTSSNSNVFSRIMNSEMSHVEQSKRLLLTINFLYFHLIALLRI